MKNRVLAFAKHIGNSGLMVFGCAILIAATIYFGNQAELAGAGGAPGAAFLAGLLAFLLGLISIVASVGAISYMLGLVED